MSVLLKTWAIKGFAKTILLLLTLTATKCEATTAAPSGPTTTTAPVFTEDLPPEDPIQCYFLDSTELASNESLQWLVYNRCQKPRSEENMYAMGGRSINVDDFRCGVRNASTEDEIKTSELCISDAGSGVVTTFQHKIHMKYEEYYKDYMDVRKNRFRARKLQLEKDWTELYYGSDVMQTAKFEALVIVSMEKGSSTGVDVTAFVQFAGAITKADYEAEWSDLSEAKTKLDKYALTTTEDVVSAPELCPELNTIQANVPADIWTASGLDANLQLSVGSSVNFMCPSDKKLSMDNDGFNDHDDKYTVTCTTRKSLKAPKVWPTCVAPCWRRLPVPPGKTGLSPVVPPNTIPAGQYGKYICNDTTLGVNQGPSEYFPVMCRSDSTYAVPIESWPVCQARTTTISPVLSLGLKGMLKRYTDRLEYRYKAYQWQDGDENSKPVEGENYMTTVTIPSLLGLLLAVVAILMITRNDSPICRICSEDGDVPEKKIVELDQKQQA